MAKKNDSGWQEARDCLVAEELKSKRVVKARTPNQEKYLKAIQESVITLASGPAGCGKTYLACWMASQMLRERKVDKIIISRPLIECDESLGYLPGDLNEKVAPFLAPVTEAFGEFFHKNDFDKFIREGAITVCPLAYMRGRSFKNAFIILDEAENGSYRQLHMLLTRFGQGCKVVVSGDITQSDLPHRGPNPLGEIMKRLKGRPEISMVKLTRADIQRHELIEFVDRRLSGGGDGDLGCDIADELVKDGEAWYRLTCPKCQANVWFSNGDEDDDETEDIGETNCWKCGKALKTGIEGEGVAQGSDSPL